MNKVIYKYPLDITDQQTIEMPAGAKLLSVAMQQNVACIWALVDPIAPLENKAIYIFGTGHPINEQDIGKFIGTIFVEHAVFVFHVFEAKED